ncbi:MAG: type III-B CRISPR module RAMP protein Cmr4 [Deltaproteobacteria bacterium]|nr:type III-B CRISPR module RAMP protein Cmr4 [Deltaproteobacteria bacterium]
MLTDSVVLSLYFETPLHTSASGAPGAIDLPIQRERTTQWPMVHASEVRESLRKALGATADALFGGADAEAALSLGDARLLLFPVRCSVAPFVWITCPAVLARLRRDLERTVGIALPALPAVGNDDILVSSAWSHGTDAFAIEDVVLTPKSGLEAAALLDLLPAPSGAYEGFAREVDASLGVVSDEVFGFLVRSATELAPVPGRNGSQLFEEMVPPDALFYVPVSNLGAQGKGSKKQSATQQLEKALPTHLQVGDAVQLGRGWARTALLKAKGGNA